MACSVCQGRFGGRPWRLPPARSMVSFESAEPASRVCNTPEPLASQFNYNTKTMKLRTWALVIVFSLGAAAQKRPLTHEDYDSWRSIQNPHLSADGIYLGYALFPQEGDGE